MVIKYYIINLPTLTKKSFCILSYAIVCIMPKKSRQRIIWAILAVIVALSMVLFSIAPFLQTTRFWHKEKTTWLVLIETKTPPLVTPNLSGNWKWSLSLPIPSTRTAGTNWLPWPLKYSCGWKIICPLPKLKKSKSFRPQLKKNSRPIHWAKPKGKNTGVYSNGGVSMAKNKHRKQERPFHVVSFSFFLLSNG